MPITGKVHQPPPVHQVFEGANFVVCNFCPRKVDYHPQSIPVPYYHSNVDSDEVMFYVGGDYEARKGSGIGIGSISLHPGGHAHGPQPSAIEASIGAEYFDELAVMVDTFRPLELGEAGLAVEDPAYAWTWAGRGPAAAPLLHSWSRRADLHRLPARRQRGQARVPHGRAAGGPDRRRLRGRRDPHPDRQRAGPHLAAQSRTKVVAALEAAMLADRGFEVPVVLMTPAELVEVHEEALELEQGRELHRAHVVLLAARRRTPRASRRSRRGPARARRSTWASGPCTCC